MKRLTLLSALLSVSLFACGDDDGGGTPDARTPDAAEPDATEVDIDAAAPDATPAVTCTPAKPLTAGNTTIDIQSDGTARQYVIYVPESYDGTKGVSVVFDFHGSGSNPEQELQITALNAAADEEGFIVVLPIAVVPFPQGGFTWNVPVNDAAADDLQFVTDVLADVNTKACVDTKHVYATGYSGGGRLATLLACTHDDVFAAIGTVGGLRFTDPCEATRQVPIIAFHGTADAINPYNDNVATAPPYWGTDGVETALDKWATKLGCDDEATTGDVTANVDKLSYAGCDGESEIVLYKVTDGGHTWPGTEFPFPANPFGSVTQEIDATDLQVEFFASHSLP